MKLMPEILPLLFLLANPELARGASVGRVPHASAF